jgi:hypothetical protein
MGTWGVGLYSNDFASDLRSSVRAVARLPFDPDRLLDVISRAEPSAAGNTGDSDHTVFWLTVADQFATLGIDCPTARARALTIISDGADLAAMAALGMDAKSLARRRNMLENLRARISAPPLAAKPRAVLKTPQKLLLEVGEMVTYPVGRNSGGYYEPINPYAVGRDWAWVRSWQQDGWGALVVAERGLLFDFLAWYRPLVVSAVLASEPTMSELAAARTWMLRQAGTLTARHCDNSRLKAVGRIEIDHAKLEHFFPDRGIPLGPVVNDVSLSNSMTCAARDSDDPLWDNNRMALRPCLAALADIAVGTGTGEEARDRRNLSGRWQGQFRYDGAGRMPGSFRAVLNEVSGLLRGRVDDAASVTGTLGRPIPAVVEGRRDGRAVRFFKRYISATARYRPIEYCGEVDKGGRRIAGRWSIRESSAGDFVMTRPEGEG